MSLPRISAVIPTLNAAAHLPETLEVLAPALEHGLLIELLVADGGSTDRTLALAEAGGARVVRAPRGRGPQLAAGAAEAKGDWLFFLHADSQPKVGWKRALEAFCRPENEKSAAVFRLHLDSSDPRARRVERLANWRSRVLGLPYGDQGLVISRRLYDQLGGFAPLPIMEDVALVRRIGRRRLTLLPVEMLTSARRYRRDGWWFRPLRNLSILAGYFLGLPPVLLARWYR